MSAHKDAAALVTTIAAQTETIRQLSARLDQLENRMKGTPCEGAVQQLVGDAGAFLQKRPRPSSSDDDESSSDDSVEDCAQMSISCRGCQVQGTATGISDRAVHACCEAIEQHVKALAEKYDTDFDENAIDVEADVYTDEDPSSANAVRCTFSGQHGGLDEEDCVDLLTKVLKRQGIFEG